MTQRFVVTHTIRQTEIPTLPTGGLQTHRLSKCCVHRKIACNVRLTLR